MKILLTTGFCSLFVGILTFTVRKVYLNLTDPKRKLPRMLGYYDGYHYNSFI